MCELIPYNPTLKDLFEDCPVSQNEAARAIKISPAVLSLLLNKGTFPKRGWTEIRERLVAFLEGHGANRALIENALGRLEHPVEIEKEESAEETAQEDTMILRKQTLTIQARKVFGITRNPFGDPGKASEIYLSDELRLVREMLFDVATNGGFMALVGESGSGKSTLREELIERIAKESPSTVIVEPYTLAMAESDKNGKPLRSQHIVESIISTVSPNTLIPSSPEMRFRKLHQLLKTSWQAGTHHCLIIEEAHDMHRHTLKSLKRFYELKDGLHRLLSIILIGQTELEQKLKNTDAAVREVVQRCDIVRVGSIEDIIGFLGFRFSRAGLDIDKMITLDGIKELKRRLTVAQDNSGRGVYMGYPLMIANLTIAALNLAAEVGERQVSADVVRMVQP